MFRTSNPVLRPEVFNSNQWRGNDIGVFSPDTAPPISASARTIPGAMTVQGTAIKAGILTAVLTASAIASYAAASANQALTMPLMLGGMLVALVLGLVMYFKPAASPFLAPAYAVFKGAFVGIFTLLYAHSFRPTKAIPADVNIIGQAVGLTIAVAGAVSVAYATRIIRLGTFAVKAIFAMTSGLALFYLAQMLLSMVFNINVLGAVHGSGMIGIGFSIFVVVLAALNLIWNFQTVEEGAAAGAPKYMEWYSAYGILVTIVWLYIEILRLLGKLRGK